MSAHVCMGVHTHACAPLSGRSQSGRNHSKGQDGGPPMEASVLRRHHLKC